jgi:hypothetical protein
MIARLLLMLLMGEPPAAGNIELQLMGQEGALTNVADIVSRMQEYSRRHSELLQTYENIRNYHVEYRGIIKKSADITVRLMCTSGKKQFEVQSESGSKFLISHVLRKLLESEAEAAQGAERQRSAISPDNYEFRLIANETPPDHKYYVIQAIPKKKAKYLFDGKIWVDGRDFAVTRIEAKPASNPSWWIKDVKILQQYQKVGNFWVYESNESVSKVRIGGSAILRISYGKYAGADFCSGSPEASAPCADQSAASQ